MPISPSILAEAASLTAPITSPESGKNPAGDERYQELRLEVDKESSPTGETVQWSRVAELGGEVLRKLAKDLLIAAYTAFALYRTRGLEGLAVGLATVDLLFEHHWQTMSPPVARLKGRGAALRWLLEHACEAVARHTPVPAEGPALASLIDITRALRTRSRELLGDHVPSFKEWSDLLESMRQTLPPDAMQAATEAAPVSAATPATASPTTSPASEAAAPASAAAVGEDPRALVAAWLVPIAGADPAGSDAFASDEYQGLLAEVDKLQSPSGGAIDWPRVIKLGDTVLRTQCKDLRVACHLALAHYRTERLAGLALGLALVAELSDVFWETMQPPVSRVRGRLGTLRGLLDQIEPELASYAPTPADEPAIDRLKAGVQRLGTVLRARLGEQAPPLRPLLQTIEQLAMTVTAAAPAPAAVQPREPAPPVAAPAAPSATPVPPPTPSPPPVTATPVTTAPVEAPASSLAAPTGDIANSAAVDRFLRQTGEEMVKLAAALRRARNADPSPYRLLRSGLWIYIVAAPPSQPDGTTGIPALGEKDRARLEGLHSNGRWPELLEASESLLPLTRFALDLHRFSADALQNLGSTHEAARHSLTAELGALLRRLPRVLELKAKDGTALADEATRAWIEREVLQADSKASTSAPSAAPARPAGAEAEQLRALFAANKRDEALGFGATQIQQAGSGLEKFMRRLELAEACAASKDAPLARTLFTGLLTELDAQRLDTWDPQLAARCLDGLARVIPKGQAGEKPMLDAVLTRLASLDPLRAASIK